MLENVGIGEIIIIGIIIFLFYFLPTWIAFSRKKRNVTPILLVNLLLGWSIIGWIVALIWAVSTQTVDVVQSSEVNVIRSSSQQATGRFCSDCGKFSLPESKFCAHCGKSFA